MLSGLSTSRRCESSAQCLADEGKAFVFRYHSRTTSMPQKRLHPAEAATLAREEVAIAAVYQDRARELSDFGPERGEQDAISALTYAGQVGQPVGSAVYFAVDSDFSADEIKKAVIPYFRGIDRIFREAGGGTAHLNIGVYGSGLTCRLVGGLSFVSFRWLAEATKWRESKDYEDWHVKQIRNTGQTLCALESNFEICEAHDTFGQFRPVGFDVLDGQGPVRRVSAEGGSLRHLPATKFNEPIAILPGGHDIHVLGESAPGWQRVRTTLGGGVVIGHIADSALETATGATQLLQLGNAGPTHVVAVVPSAVEAQPAPVVAPDIPAASLTEDKSSANRQSTNGRAFPIGEAGRKTRSLASPPAERVQQLKAIADWLVVEKSKRYQPTPEATFCNVYAADYCYLASVYLPRVWWTDAALLRIGKGEKVPVLYAKTVRELRADDLFAWLCDMGPSFGWKRVFDPTALQNAANGGGIGLVCADRAEDGRSGHITVVVPEVDAHEAVRDPDGNVLQPLQSQAGSRNFRYGSAGPNWWMGSQFVDRGFFVHE